MKKVLFAIVLILPLLMACQEKKYPVPDVDRYRPDTTSMYTPDDSDSVEVEKKSTAANPTTATKKSSTPYMTRGQLYSPARSGYYDYDEEDEGDDEDKEEEDDGMRGFDPTMEDDMEDNGMTRYMEVYDEEGWQ
ncbi:MAG: hypothetical protein IKR91_04880 [Alloprevotella sp.]|nr:hypothetical protein [Alloprevotella sp.]